MLSRTTAPPTRGTRAARLVVALGCSAAVVSASLTAGADAADPPDTQVALEPAECGPGSRPETGTVGRVPAEEFASGRAAEGYTCNTELVSHTGRSGGFKVERYEDAAGRVCAFYDVSRMFPVGVFQAGVEGLGTAVLAMDDPARPRRTATLLSPAMLSPHESLILNQERGLLVAVMGNAGTAPGFLDVYDVRRNCRQPQLLSSTPAGFLGHESGFSPDGRTFYASSLLADTITAVDLTDPRLPRPLTTFPGGWSHGVRTSPDGNLLYVADMGYPDRDSYTSGGLKIYDVREINQRRPFPRAKLVSTYTWPDVAIPQVPEPMRIGGRDYVLMVDEFTELAADAFFSYRPSSSPAVARIIDVGDPRKPVEVSALRLEVHLEENREGDQRNDPGAQSPLGGYASHYCGLPRSEDPLLVACSYIGSGLRVFDISDPAHPEEVAYFNKPTAGGGYAMAKPAFDVPRKQVWFSDVDGGFFAVRLTNDAWPEGL
jgi:hypothetical protein